MVGSHLEALYVYDKVAGKIHVYTFTGDFLRTIATEYMANNISLLPDGSFLCFTPDFIYNGPWAFGGCLLMVSCARCRWNIRKSIR